MRQHDAIQNIWFLQSFQAKQEPFTGAGSDMADDIIDKIIGQNIRMQRTLRGWNQTYLGEQLGVSFQQVQKYERGIDSVRPARLKLLAELFGCSLHDLFYDPMAFPDSADIMTPGRLETAKIRSLIRHFIRIESPALQDHACAIMRILSETEKR